MKQTIKVAQILAGAPIGGAENFYARLVAALGSVEGIEQRAFTRANPEREQQLLQAGVPVTRFRLGSDWHWFDNWRYRRALRDWQPDVAVTYMNRATRLTPNGDYKLVARLGHYYDLKYYRHCDYWIGIAKGICQHLIDGGFPRDRVFYIPNFVDETVAEALPRDSFDTNPEQPILLALGRLHVNKGFDVLLQSLQAIPEATLWLAGDGPEGGRLRQQAEQLGVLDRVRFLGWRRDVNALMRSADIFVCPSRHEGLGSIVGEAWFNRCPIVATASQGPAELIEHERTGLVTPVDNSEQLADAILQLLHNPAAASQLAENAYRHYMDNYSRAIICQQYADLFQQLVKQD